MIAALACLYLSGAKSIKQVAIPAGSQRIYAYNPRQLEDWNRVHGYDPFLEQNRIKPNPNQTITDASSRTGFFGGSRAPLRFSFNGNFGATFFVRGVGAVTNAVSEQYIDIYATRRFVVDPQNFTGLRIGTTAVTGQGSIYYEFEVFDGPSSNPGATNSNVLSGIDTAINGGSITLLRADVPADGLMCLRIRRQVTLTSLTSGATTYNATGQVKFTTN